MSDKELIRELERQVKYWKKQHDYMEEYASRGEYTCEKCWESGWCLHDINIDENNKLICYDCENE